MKALLEQNLFTCLGLTVFLWSFHYAQTSLRARKRGISAGGLGHGSVSLAAAELFQRTLLATGRPGSVSWLKLQACPQPFCEQGVLCHLPAPWHRWMPAPSRPHGVCSRLHSPCPLLLQYVLPAISSSLHIQPGEVTFHHEVFQSTAIDYVDSYENAGL